MKNFREDCRKRHAENSQTRQQSGRKHTSAAYIDVGLVAGTYHRFKTLRMRD